MANCAKCGAALNPGATFCGSCGTPVVVAGGAPASGGSAPAVGGLAPNIAGMLAYFTIIPAILFLVLEPFNKDKFVRFHAFQSIALNVLAIGVWIVLFIVSIILGKIPILGGFVALLIHIACWLGLLALWAFLVYKAYNNEKFEIPVVGKFATQQAG